MMTTKNQSNKQEKKKLKGKKGLEISWNMIIITLITLVGFYFLIKIILKVVRSLK